jgi:uncharacterized protein YecE (DUF72 family)
MEIKIGTSGWNYDDWVGEFYPPDLPCGDYLSFYSKHFDIIEVNSTFYRLPFVNYVKSWKAKTPENFRFCVKMFGKISHQKHLRAETDNRKVIDEFFERINIIKERVEIILIQLPQDCDFSEDKLEKFFSLLPKEYRYALEFRNEECLKKGFLDACANKNIIPVGVSSPKIEFFPDNSRFNTLYFRFHGKDRMLHSLYTDNELKEFAEKIKISGFEKCFIFFNNTSSGFAVENAKRLKELLS